MNLLEVRYDDDGNRHYWRDGEEISESEWMQQHPHMRKGKSSGRDRGSDSGDVGDGDERLSASQQAEEQRKEQVRQGIRNERAKSRARQAE